LQFSISVTPAAVIREERGVYSVLGKPVHLPWLAAEATGTAILWTLTLVMRHFLRPHVCHLGAPIASSFKIPSPTFRVKSSTAARRNGETSECQQHLGEKLGATGGKEEKHILAS
jgi:hypothetical protein